MDTPDSSSSKEISKSDLSDAPDSSSSKSYKPPYDDMSLIGKVLSDDKEMMKLFDMWLLDHHKKSYESEEEKLKRFQIFKGNAKLVYEGHLSLAPHDCHCGLNVYADITFEEFGRYCCGDRYSDTSDEEGEDRYVY